jgi:hypothetical protein
MSMSVARIRLNQSVTLDWSKLLGFDQVRLAQQNKTQMTKQVLLAKVGNGKTGVKRGTKGN